MSTTPVDTKHVTHRRHLRFDSLDDILADAEHLAHAGHLKTLGNWSVGQLFKHIAIVMNIAIDGTEVKPPWFVRIMGRYFMKGRMLARGMPAGFRLPDKQQEAFYPQTEVSLEEGLQALRDAVQRLKTDRKRLPSVFLGPLTAEEWDQLHCRHAELHFSFIMPE